MKAFDYYMQKNLRLLLIDGIVSEGQTGSLSSFGSKNIYVLIVCYLFSWSWRNLWKRYPQCPKLSMTIFWIWPQILTFFFEIRSNMEDSQINYTNWQIYIWQNWLTKVLFSNILFWFIILMEVFFYYTYIYNTVWLL